MRPTRVEWCCEHCGKKDCMRPYACKDNGCWICHACATGSGATCDGAFAERAWREGSAQRLRLLREAVDEYVNEADVLDWASGDVVAVACEAIRRHAAFQAVFREIEPNVREAAERQVRKRGVIRRLTPPEPSPPPSLTPAGAMLSGAVLGALGGWPDAKGKTRTP